MWFWLSRCFRGSDESWTIENRGWNPLYIWRIWFSPRHISGSFCNKRNLSFSNKRFTPTPPLEEPEVPGDHKACYDLQICVSYKWSSFELMQSTQWQNFCQGIKERWVCDAGDEIVALLCMDKVRVPYKMFREEFRNKGTVVHLHCHLTFHLRTRFKTYRSTLQKDHCLLSCVLSATYKNILNFSIPDRIKHEIF